MSTPNNVPSTIGLPGGAPQDIRGVALWMVQLSMALNTYAAIVASAVNKILVDVEGTGVTGDTGTKAYTLQSLVAQLKSTSTIPS